jgi:phosphonate transport system substrate-binding protein
MFSEVNELDARAAMKVWIMTVASEQNIPVDPNPNIFGTIDELANFGRDKSVDGFGVITPEFPRLSQEVQFDRFAAGIRNGIMTEEYVLLVYRGSGIERLEQLKGKTLNVLHNPRMSLALPWLDTVLMENGYNSATEFFRRISSHKKASQVGMSVFFGKEDACLMTRASFRVMGELNPQMNRQLHILALSPALVPSGFAFRSEGSQGSRVKILDAIARLNESEAGRQILLLTKADRIAIFPIACLDDSLRLLAKHRRLSSRANRTN